MIFYHGTSEDKWALIQKEGVLWGYSSYRNYRYTYLTPDIGIAKKYGNVILEVEYEPVGVDGRGIDNYCFDYDIPEEERKRGAKCWQFSVFVPISINNVKRLMYAYLRNI